MHIIKINHHFVIKTSINHVVHLKHDVLCQLYSNKKFKNMHTAL